MSFVGNTVCALSGIGKDTLDRLFRSHVCEGLVVWGLSLAGGLGGILGWVGKGLSMMIVVSSALVTWWCFAPEGSCLPSVRACFFLYFIHLGVGWLTFCLK